MTSTLGAILRISEKKEERRQAEPFFPEVPATLEQTGINQIFIEDLICKLLLSYGSLSGKDLSRKIGLPLKLFKDLLYGLKQRLLISHQLTSGIDDFIYILTEDGREKALFAREHSNYMGCVPVRLEEYISSIEKQSIRSENPGRKQLENAFKGLVLPERYYNAIGPAVNSARGLFLYGDPGNGKTEIATRICKCFTSTVYIPRTIIAEGMLIQLYDPQCHTPVNGDAEEKADRRWVKIERPAVVVGGEMDLDSLEIGFNSQTKICEASLQLKGNNGIFVIDDFGRQRVGPETLLNRWMLPLEKEIDYLTLPSGNKIMVPFNALLVFCSNLDPGRFLDEAFLRRIPYKIHMQDPSEKDFVRIFEEEASNLNVPYDRKAIDDLLEKHFRGVRSLRSCHPRDILQQLINIARYENRELCMTGEDLERSIHLYFAATGLGENR